MVTKKSDNEVFFQSCKIGDLKTIKTELFYNVSPFTRDRYGNNALHLACMNNQPKVLEYMFNTVKTYKNDIQNKLGRTALNIAASQGAFECIAILLKYLPCDINSTDKNFKNTPLHWCVNSKCLEGVRLLLNQGADFKLINKFGKTPLQLAEKTCLEIFYLIDEFVKKQKIDQCLYTAIKNCNNTETKIIMNSKSPSNSTQFKITAETSTTKITQKKVNQQNNETILGSDFTTNNSNEQFYLDISKLKDGDNSVLKLLEKSIEPVDDTSFVSSILNSGKVIQLTEAGLLALEYTKNEINTSIPDHVVQSFFKTSKQQLNKNKNSSDNINLEKDKELDLITHYKGLKRLKSPQYCSKRFKCTETTTDKKSECESLLGQFNCKYTKTIPRDNNLSSYSSQCTSSVDNIVMNNEMYSKNQLVCLNTDINTQSKWVEDFMSLLTDIVEHKSITST